MSEATTVHGIVLSSMPVGESDRRLLILTKEYGKISAFAKGARRPNSALVAVSQPFTYAEFKMYMGKSSNTVVGADNTNFFMGIRDDIDAMYYGMYFCELVDYFTRDGNDESDMMKLLYTALRALEQGEVDKNIIRSAFELKAISVFGESPAVYKCIICGEDLKKDAVFVAEKNGACCTECAKTAGIRGIRLSDSAVYAMQYTISSDPSKVFTFDLKPDVANEFRDAVRSYLERHVDREMKSLTVIEQL